MGDPRGFIRHGREMPKRRPVPVRLRDWKKFMNRSVRGSTKASLKMHGLRYTLLQQWLSPRESDT